MVAAIGGDAYPFLAFTDLTCHLEDTEYGFSGCTVPPDSKESEFRSSDQEASVTAGKNTGVVLVPCSRMEDGIASLQLLPVVWIFLMSSQ